MSLSKGDISDLDSLILRVRQCALSAQAADWDLKEADRRLKDWLYLHTETGETK
jgi:hypothetical protein